MCAADKTGGQVSGTNNVHRKATPNTEYCKLNCLLKSLACPNVAKKEDVVDLRGRRVKL